MVYVHPHGEHDCYCPLCGTVISVGESVKCNTLPCPSCGTRMRALGIGERRVQTPEIVGHSQSEFAADLDLVESSMAMGENARITICTKALPTEDQLEDIRLGMILQGCHVSHPTAQIIQGIATTEFVLRKGSPQWQVIIPILIPLFTLGLIAFGITKLEAISKALMPIILSAGGLLILFAVVMRKPAEKYIERGGRIPRLPETKKVLAAR